MEKTEIIYYLENLYSRENSFMDKWKSSYIYLEYNHSYIQWLFPLNERSSHNKKAPILTEKEISEIRHNEKIKENLIHSLDIMLNFYGLQRANDTTQMIRQKRFHSIKKRWLRKNNHNFMRITRIIKCLKMCGLGEYAIGFYNELFNIYQENKTIIGDSIDYWHNAIR